MKVDYIVFTDASLKRVGSNNCYAGYASIVMSLKDFKYTTVSGELSNPSIVFCEAWAIFRGLQLVNRIKSKKNVNVMVISDNKLNIMSLSKWALTSWDTSDYFNWKKSDGSKIKLQKIYRMIFKVIGDGGLSVKFVHVNGHLDSRSKLKPIVKDKLKDAGVKVTDETMDIFIKMNCLADKLATEASENLKNSEGEFIRLKHKPGKE